MFDNGGKHESLFVVVLAMKVMVFVVKVVLKMIVMVMTMMMIRGKRNRKMMIIMVNIKLNNLPMTETITLNTFTPFERYGLDAGFI